MKTLKANKRYALIFGLTLCFLLSMVLCFSTILSNKNVFAKAEATECNGDHTGWLVLPDSGGFISTSANYYLAEDTYLKTNITINNVANVNLCLNGYKLTGAENSIDSVIRINGQATLNIYDCNGSHGIHSYKIVSEKDTSDATKNNLFNYKYYDFTKFGDGVIYGGLITGGKTINTGSSAIMIGGNFVSNYSGGDVSGATVTIYGGTIAGNYSTRLSVNGYQRYRSGAIGVVDGGKLYFKNGMITGNSARYGGSAIYNFGGKVYLEGGTITNNYSVNWGGAIYSDVVTSTSSPIYLSGTPKIFGNLSYVNADDKYIEMNYTFSSETANYAFVNGKLSKTIDGKTEYAWIGLYGGNKTNVTSGYGSNGNSKDEVNSIFFSDDLATAVAYNDDNNEIQYIVSNDNKTATYDSNNGTNITITQRFAYSFYLINNSFDRQGYTFVSWNTAADGSGTDYYEREIVISETDVNLYAKWQKNSYSITYIENNSDSSVKTEKYSYGETVTLPTPTWQEYTFGGWYESAMLVGTPVTQLSATDFGDKTYYAKWNAPSYTLTADVGENGTMTPSGSIIYNGISQDYVITPDQGFRINTFTVGGVDKSGEIVAGKYTVSGIEKDTDIAVTFTAITANDKLISASSDGNGTISPSGITAVSEGESQKYNFTPNAGCYLYDVIVDGVSVLDSVTDNSYTFTNVTANHTISATFKKTGAILTIGGTNTYFETFAEAIAAASGDSTITISGVHTYDKQIDVGGSHTIKTLTLKSLGTATLDINTQIYIWDNEFVIDGENLTINSTSRSLIVLGKGAFTMNSGAINYNSPYSLIDMHEGTININGGLLENRNLYGEVIGSSIVTATGTINITGGTLKTGFKNLLYFRDGDVIVNLSGTPTLIGNLSIYSGNKINGSLNGTYFTGSASISFNNVNDFLKDEIVVNGASKDSSFSLNKVDGKKLIFVPQTENADIGKYVVEMLTYSITYNKGAYGSGEIAPMQKTHGEPISLSSEKFTRIGYVQTGWSKAEGAVKYLDLGADCTINSNLELFPYWTVIVYKVEYELNGGVNNVDNPIGYTIEDAITLKEPTKLGYTFSGWSDDGAIAKGSIGDKKFAATWAIKKYDFSNINTATTDQVISDINTELDSCINGSILDVEQEYFKAVKNQLSYRVQIIKEIKNMKNAADGVIKDLTVDNVTVDQNNDVLGALALYAVDNVRQEYLDETYKSDLSSKMEKCEQLLAKIEQLRKANIDNLNAEITSLKSQIVTLNAEIEKLNQQITQLNANIENLNKEIARLNAEIERLNALLKSGNEDSETLNTEIKNLKTEKGIIEKELKEKIAEKIVVDEKLQTTTTEKAAVESKLQKTEKLNEDYKTCFIIMIVTSVILAAGAVILAVLTRMKKESEK